MPSTFSDLLRLEKQAAGENDTTWGTKLNVLFEIVEDAIAGRAAITHSDAASYTLTTANGTEDEARKAILNIGGALTAARNTVVPTSAKLYVAKNATTGGFATTLKTAAGTGIVIPNGKTSLLFCDGTNVVNAIDYLDTLTVPDANLSIVDEADQTKVGKFQMSGLTTGQTRTLTWPNFDGTIATLAGTETLTNKTLTSPVLTTPALGVATATSINGLTITTSTGTLTVTNGKTLSASNTLTLAGTDGTTITFQGSDTYVGRATTDTLTNKTIALGSNTVSGTLAQFNTACSDADFASLAGSETLSNKTLASPIATGQILAADGSAGAPAYSWSSQPTYGLFVVASSRIGVAIDGTELAAFISGNSFRLAGGTFSLGPSTTAPDTILVRDAANVLAQRNSTNAQMLRVYNTFTDASNFERADVGWSSNALFIRTTKSGTGAARGMILRTDGAAGIELWTNDTRRIDVNSSGHLIWNTDNTLDIGASGATRPRSLYWGTQALAPDGSVGTPAFAFSSATGTGLYVSGGVMRATITGANSIEFVADGIRLGGDVLYVREAANVGSMRNGTNAQTLRVYNTFTDASNYERLVSRFSSNVAQIFTDVAGTGTTRALSIGVGSTSLWQFTTAGHFVQLTDNAHDIGASGANRPRSIYVGTSLVVPTVNGLTITTSTGTLTITNAKTVSVSNTLTFAGTDGTTITFQGSDTYVGRATTDTLTNKTLTSPTINAGTLNGIDTLSLNDSDSAFNLTIASTSTLTAGRTLTLDVDDAARTLRFGGNLTLAAAFITSGANSLTLTTTGATNVTLPTSGTLATTAGASGTSLVLIESQTVSGVASVTFTTGISSTYDVYELHCTDVVPGSDTVALYLQGSTDGGSSYLNTNEYAYASDRQNSASAEFIDGSLTDIGVRVDGQGIGNAANEFLSGKITLFGLAGASRYKGVLVDVVQLANDAVYYALRKSAVIKTTSAVNALRLLTSSGNISGTFSLYGVRKA